MSPDPPTPPQKTGLIIKPGADLVALPHVGSPALSEIIDRSLVHIRTSKSLATLTRQAGDECEFEIAPGTMMRMCWIPPGEFLMGSPENEVGRSEDETQHRVTISKGFWLGKYQVTQAQWKAVMGNIPSLFPSFTGSNLPVGHVSWDSIAGPGGFLDKINRFGEEEGRFSMPTEAQWEYACRAGTTTAFNNGKNLTADFSSSRNMDEVAWFVQNSNYHTQPVGLKKANAWGLHDMHGNVREWCADWVGIYPTAPEIDPRGPHSGSRRVGRGGSWGSAALYCRSADRNDRDAGIRTGITGVRVIRSSVT